MRRLLSAALLVAATTISPLPALVASAAPSPVAAVGVRAVADPADAIPYVEEIRAALTMLGAPTINEHALPDSDPLWDLFDEAAKYVAVPTVDTNEVRMVVGAYNVEDGTDERQDFQETYKLLQAYAQKRGPRSEFKPVTGADLAGANEAYSGYVVSQQGGADTNLMFIKLARFGKTVTVVSTDTNLKTSPVSEGDIFGLALINEVIAQLVANKAK